MYGVGDFLLGALCETCERFVGGEFCLSHSVAPFIVFTGYFYSLVPSGCEIHELLLSE